MNYRHAQQNGHYYENTRVTQPTCPLENRQGNGRIQLVRFLIAASVFMGILVAMPARAASFVLIPDAYGHVRSFASQTFADAPIQLLDQALINLEDRGVMEFDVSGITGSVVSAELFLPLQRGSFIYGDVTVQLAPYSGDGAVNFADDFNPGPIEQTFVANGGTPQSSATVDVTSIVDGLLAGGASFIGFTGGFDLPTSPHQATLQFGQNITSPGFEVWPELRVETVVVPVIGALPLLVSGLAVFGIRRRPHPPPPFEPENCMDDGTPERIDFTGGGTSIQTAVPASSPSEVIG